MICPSLIKQGLSIVGAVMSRRLENKIAIVTGAGGGIGRAVVQRFVEEGALVIAGDIDEQAGEACVEAAGNSERVRFCRLDAGDEASWRLLMERTLALFGGLNIVVNNAAFRIPVTLDQTSLDIWHQNQRVTADGVFLGTKFAGQTITGKGSIVNVSSIGAFVGLPPSFPYSAAKGAVRALSRTAALHFAGQKKDIRVNVVAPGGTLTDAVKNQTVEIAQRESTSPQDVMAKLTRDIPMNRMAHPSEIANAILFLASDESSFMTGAELIVDGGQTAQ
jgi:3(or 17)beta-hydroxysteroid dehydrogenase